MPAFLRKFMRYLPGSLGAPKGPRAVLGAFGKHPAWNDHIDPDLGLDDRLIRFKQLLYLDGIRDRAIPSWHKSDATQLVQFGHVFAWEMGNEVIVGRLWHSSDGRGRDDFPMVVCAHCQGLPTSWALNSALPVIDRVQASLQRTSDRDAAIAVVEQGRQDLAALATHASPDGSQNPSAQALAKIANCQQVTETGLLRILHVLRDSDFGADEPTHAEQVRVPSCGATPVEAITLWAGALEATLGRAPSMMFLAPTDQSWLDILVGIPDPGQFLALRSSLNLLPLTTEIAYTLDDAFSSQKRALFHQAQALNAATTVA